MSSPSEVEHILSPASQDTPKASTSPLTSSGPDRAAVKGGAKLKWSPPVDNKISVFDIHNIFRHRWFLSRAILLTNVISAQKDEDGNISWVEFFSPIPLPPGQVCCRTSTSPSKKGEKGDVCIYFGAS